MPVATTESTWSSPIIVIGMHRSGTTLLGRILTQMGVGMGRKLWMQNHEDPFFQHINDWMMSLSGASWSNPGSASLLLENVDLREAVGRHLRGLLRSPYAARSRGWEWYRTSIFEGGGALSSQWGWKDPRNTFTLPIWLDLFPDAKIIHIYRNGIDVARSLQVRAEADVGEICQWVDTVSPLRFLRPLPRPPVAISLRCLSLDEGFRLWEQYIETAEAMVESLPAERTLTIRYEEFLASPSAGLERLSAFLDAGCSNVTLEAIASRFRADRGEAYKRDPDLVRFRESVKDSAQMRHYGY